MAGFLLILWPAEAGPADTRLPAFFDSTTLPAECLMVVLKVENSGSD